MLLYNTHMLQHKQRKRKQVFQRQFVVTALFHCCLLLSYVPVNGALDSRKLRTKGNTPDIIPSLTYVGEPPLDPVTLQYGKCQGRCTQHSHCQSGLSCIQRVPDDSIVSTCLPAQSDNETVTNTLRLLNYCAIVPDNELVTLVTGNTSDPTANSTLQHQCSGGCMTDDDCTSGGKATTTTTNYSLVMKCSTSSQTSIPGCTGYKHPLINYCYYDDSIVSIPIDDVSSRTMAPSATPIATSAPVLIPQPSASGNHEKPLLQYIGEPPFDDMFLKQCQGDCDSDWNCDYGLNCFKRSDGTPIPGCSNVYNNTETNQGNDIYSVDYCYIPPPNTLVIVQGARNNNNSTGNINVTGITTKAGPCEGTCFTDSDCLDGLQCYIRKNYERVPGCYGLGAYATNYCYKPDETNNDDVFNGTSSDTTLPTVAPVHTPTAVPTETTGVVVPSPTGTIETVSPTISRGLPEGNPTISPTLLPSRSPSISPSTVPSGSPTLSPTTVPSSGPSNLPSVNPTISPSFSPSSGPSTRPSSLPHDVPSAIPSSFPSMFTPSENPTVTTSEQPSSLPSGFAPSENPTVTVSEHPSSIPTIFTPSENPTVTSSEHPSAFPTVFTPSENPTVTLSEHPTSSPSENPTVALSELPSLVPSIAPTIFVDGNGGTRDLPTMTPTAVNGKVNVPSSVLPISSSPIITPSSVPSVTPLDSPSENPSVTKSMNPTSEPSSAPSTTPFDSPSENPSITKSINPTAEPSFLPSHDPSYPPSNEPTIITSTEPTFGPSSIPSNGPSIAPSHSPSVEPSQHPSIKPSGNPIIQPSDIPSTSPSFIPSASPLISPSFGPSGVPTVFLPSMISPIGGDSNCDDVSINDRANTIFQRISNQFQYKNDEISNVTNYNNSTATSSYRQAAYEWIVHNDEQVACSNSTNVFQRYALASLYFACGGDEWTISSNEGYLSNTVSECEWYGVACDDTNETVIGLHLDNSSLTGTLPQELSILSNVQELNIDSNRILGSIPSWLSQWTQLEVIDMDHNLLTGTIPSSLYTISALRVLDLDSNFLTGTISESGLENWVNTLYFLQLDFNQLIGTIPSILGQFSNLQYISIFGNNFTDVILSTIENLCDETRTIYANCNLCQNSTCCVACLDI